MAAFTNAQTHIPENFKRKIEIDKQINEIYNSHVSRQDNVVSVADWVAFKWTHKELKIQQDLARYSCAESIKEANGP